MFGNRDDIRTTGNKGEVDGGVGNKRTALAGQWETPPTFTMYPSLESKQQQQQQQIQQVQVQIPNTITSDRRSIPVTNLRTPANIPDSSEEYAKALEDAYRQGAQAAAIMAQQQQIPTAASCPNFSTGASASASLQSPRLSRPRIGASSVEEESSKLQIAVELDHKIHPSPPQNHAAMSTNTVVTSAVPDTLCSSMPPPPPPSGHLHMKTQQQQPQPLVSIHHQPPYHTNEPNPHIAPMTKTTTAATNTIIASRPPAVESKSHIPGRSLSMPDMSSYTAEAEEEKRLKRLARNRHSARLRRLKKKNLVDAYETEVGILERTLKQLKDHEWGKNTDDHKAILDALSMERGQQELSPDQRTEIIQDILKQQMQQITMLQEAQREQEFLALLASHDENASGNDDDDEIFHELQNILNLSPEQKEKIRESSKGLDKEVEALDTVSASLRAMQENKWLLNEGVTKITDEFTSILHKNQKSKLLLWTDSNAEAIDQLDFVKVQPLQSAPLFSFGDETTSAGDDE